MSATRSTSSMSNSPSAFPSAYTLRKSSISSSSNFLRTFSTIQMLRKNSARRLPLRTTVSLIMLRCVYISSIILSCGRIFMPATSSSLSERRSNSDSITAEYTSSLRLK